MAYFDSQALEAKDELQMEVQLYKKNGELLDFDFLPKNYPQIMLGVIFMLEFDFPFSKCVRNLIPRVSFMPNNICWSERKAV